MSCTPKNTAASFALGLLVLGWAALAQCNELRNYALVHPFGLSSATTTREAGMGGPLSCVWDRGFANPAFAAMQDLPNIALRWTFTDFDRGPDVVSTHGHLVFPLRENTNGLQVSLFSLHSNSGLLPGGGGVFVDMAEDDLSIHYGHRLGRKVVVGVGMSPGSQLRLSMWAPGGLPIMDMKAESDYGARMGLVYERVPGELWGLVYDYYQESVEGAGIAFGGLASQVFHTDLLAVGVSKYLRPNLLVAAEYQDGSSSAGATEGSLAGWHFGAECRVTPRWSLRAGLNDQQPTAGVGYRGERFELNYAFVNDWNDDIAGNVFGGSETHQLQATYEW